MTKRTRRFLPFDLKIENWESLKTYFDQLTERIIENAADLEMFIWDVSEVEAVIEEEMAWRYIRMTIDTTNEEYQKAYEFFVQEIHPHVLAYADKFNRIINEAPGKEKLPEKQQYEVYFRNLANEISIFREENIPVQTELTTKSQEYGSITGAMAVEIDGSEYTMQQAAKFLEDTSREKREKVYHLMNERRLKDKGKINTLLDELIEKRNLLAKNAGFDSYIHFRFKELNRFDYAPKDCFQFHEAVRKYFLPLVDELYEKKKEELGVDTLRPWDLNADYEGAPQLHPFETGEELLQKSIGVFQKIDPYFGDSLQTLSNMNHLDLESKKGKAPGGYNYPLYETGVPFIFMNAVGTHDDMITLMHEGGHAVHSFLTQHYKVTGFKDFPSEVAELASMSTELISMKYWDDFYADNETQKRAKWKQLERVLEVMPWVALIDHFQHWLYSNPGHSHEERRKAWEELSELYTSKVIDFIGIEEYRAYTWQKQLHIFEVPFYYIEYGIAQLGAIGVWRNYIKDSEKAMYHFKQALEAGNTATLPKVYEKAKVPFSFSDEHMDRLSKFVKKQLTALS